MGNEPFVEVRGDLPREHIDIIDAIAQANPGASRMSILREIVSAWVEQKLHEHRLIQNIVKVNGTVTEPKRRCGEG